MKRTRRICALFLLLALSLMPVLTLARAESTIASSTGTNEETAVYLFSPSLKTAEDTMIFTTEPGVLAVRIDNQCDQPVQMSVVWTDGQTAQRQTEIIDPTGSVTFGNLLEAEAAIAEIEGRSLVEDGLCPLTLTME